MTANDKTIKIEKILPLPYNGHSEIIKVIELKNRDFFEQEYPTKGK